MSEKDLLKTILIILMVFVLPSLAREPINLNQSQISIKYADELKQEKIKICPFVSLDSQKKERLNNDLKIENKKNFSKQKEIKTTSLQEEIKPASLITIGGTINSVLKLETNQEYYVNSDIIVDGGYFIHQPGAIVYWAQGTGLYVRNGGTYLSKGLPGLLCQNMGASNDFNPGFWKGITIEETASPNSEIKYSLIWDAETGIEIQNQSLNEFIEHNVIGYCTTGIKTYGSKQTKITNNFLYWNGWFYQSFVGGAGIEVFHTNNDPNIPYDPNESIVAIEQNTCLQNGTGIRIHMVDQETVVMPIVRNNISAGNFEYNYSFEGGLALSNLVLNNGSWLDPEIPGSDHLFYFDPNDWGLIIDNNSELIVEPYLTTVFLKPDSVFVNAGVEDITNTRYIGMTTCYFGEPDSGKINLGFHDSNWFYSNIGESTLKADINNNLSVGLDDLLILADYWLFDYREAYNVWLMDLDDSGLVDLRDLLIIAENWLTYPYDLNFFARFSRVWLKQVDSRIYDFSPDINQDGVINFQDFSILAEEWQKTAEADPNIIINKFINSETKEIELGISGYRSDTYHAFLFLDGCFVDEIFAFENNGTVSFNPANFNDTVEAKVVVVNAENRITCSGVKFIDLDSSIKHLRFSDSYDPNEPDYFSLVLKDPNKSVLVSAFNLANNLIWSQSYLGDSVIGYIPPEITSTNELERVDFKIIDPNQIDPNNLTIMSDSSSNLEISVLKTRWFRPKKVPNTVNSLIIIPNHWSNWFTNSHVTDTIRETLPNIYELKGRQAISHNIAWFAQNRNIKYIYYSGHGNFEFGGQLRTGVKLRDGIGFSVRASDFPDPNNIPPWCKELGGAYESGKNLSFAQMQFRDLKYVYFDACFSGRLRLTSHNNLIEGSPGSRGLLESPDSDISVALGGPAYQGWYYEGITGTRSTFSRFTINQFEKLQVGYTLYHALYYAVNKSRTDPTLLLNPAECFRIRGRENIMDIKID